MNSISSCFDDFNVYRIYYDFGRGKKLIVNDPRWRKAMDVISDSLITTFTNTSMRLYRRNPNGEMVLLPVDLSVLEC